MLLIETALPVPTLYIPLADFELIDFLNKFITSSM